MDGYSKATRANYVARKAAEKILGAVILQPRLAGCIPVAIHTQLSPYGRFVLKACTEGWGIKGIKHALDSFGLDGDDIVNEAINSVHSDPVSAFWRAIRHLCGAYHE